MKNTDIIKLLEKYGAVPTDWRHFLEEFDQLFVEREDFNKRRAEISKLEWKIDRIENILRISNLTHNK